MDHKQLDRAWAMFESAGYAPIDGCDGMLMLREDDMPKIDFYTSNGSWRLCGGKRVVGHGSGPSACIRWYDAQKTEADTGDQQPATSSVSKTDNITIGIVNSILSQVLELKQRIEDYGL